MEVSGGSCRIGLWHVHVRWSGTMVHQVRFATTGIPGGVPAPIQRYCAGQVIDLLTLQSIASEEDTLFGRIYHAVREIPYGSRATYGQIAATVGTSPRVVGRAMAQNPTPLVVPCHRVVAAHGLGGFSPAVEIKEHLLAMEENSIRAQKKKRAGGLP